MNRRIIIFTIIAMTIALIGLMGIQIYWIQSASAIKEANFRRSVNEAMAKVVQKVEWMERNKSIPINPYERMLNFNRHLPYDSVLTIGELDSLIRLQLNIRGVGTRYEFCIYKPERQEFLMERSPKFRKELIEKGNAFILFQADIYTSPEYLLIYFPREKQFLLTELWGMLLISIILIIVIVYSFTYTIATIFRQKRLSEMKSDFINNMTHEFRTPISTISLACEALSDKDLRGSGEFLDSYLSMIQEENNRLAGLSEKILQTAVIDKGQLKMNKEIIDLHEIIIDVIKNLRIQVEIKDGEIKRRLKATKPQIEGDRVHVTNLIYNLLDNANKYSPRRPLIRIITENITNGIVVIIEDNGTGISKNEQKKIFDKLYRIPTGNIHEVRGFGLGLSYVKAIVEEHHGKISLESELNKGSRFRVFLPFVIKE
ncbi:MAG: HAMP domain-containing sensor histidine kinase [Bacteroidales bacterium]|nr:HAMP domain-containing sensor histidine kinase [Bacteroidales bacterium]